MTKPKRATASEVVSTAISPRAQVTWLTALRPSDQEYVKEVAVILANTPRASIQAVADNLIETLNLPVRQRTVCETLRKLARDAAQTS